MEIKDSVEGMFDSIAKNVSASGPIAWLKYFENTPDFFMASDGQLALPNHDSAAVFIKNTLIKQISKIKLQWNNIRVDPMTAELASVGADWSETLTDFDGNAISQSGYFTAIAERTSQGWQLRNAHWSVMKTR